MSAIAWATVEKAWQDFVVACTGLADTNVMWTDGKPRPAGTYVSLWLGNVSSFGNDWAEAKRNPLVLADDVVESITASVLTLTAHVYLTGDGPIRLSTTGTAPAGLAIATDYWIVKTGANTIKLATSYLRARAGTTITITGAGTGAHTLVDTASTLRTGQEVKQTSRGIRKCELTLQCFATPAAGLVAASALPSKAAILSAAGIGFTGFDAVQAVPAFTNGTVFEPRAVVACGFYLESVLTETGSNIETAEITDLDTGRVFTVSNP